MEDIAEAPIQVGNQTDQSQIPTPTQEQPPKKKLSLDDFAQKVKTKYPEYKDIDNATLAKKIIAKYPEYGDKVDMVQKPPAFTHGYNPTPDDIKKKQEWDNDPHVKAINAAQDQRTNQQNQQATTPKKPEKKQEESVTDKIANALYLPAFNEEVNDLLIKPFLGASDFVSRTTDKLYRGITGEKKTPDWLYKQGTLINNVSKDLDKAYEGRAKPKNIVSRTAEGAVGAVPLVASLFTGEGEASLASKAPQFISRATKLLATTNALKSYHEASAEGKSYTESLKEAGKGAGSGAEQGVLLDAQMLVGGALGKEVVDKVVEKGLLKGGKAGEALLHALSTATIFGSTSVLQDVVAGKDIDSHEAIKKFGMALMFEAIPVAKSLHEEIKNRNETTKLNDQAAQAAQAAVMSTAASNLHGESVIRTLMETPKEQLQEINENVPEGHEDLYAKSIENGMKAYESDSPNEKKAFLQDQLLLKTQGDVKFIASKDNNELLNIVNNSQELTPEQKQDLTDKINSLKNEKSQNREQTEPETQTSATSDEKTDQNPISTEGDKQTGELLNQTGEAGAEPVSKPRYTIKGDEVKPKKDAVQEQETEILPVQPKAESSGGVPEENAEGEETTSGGEKDQEKVTEGAENAPLSETHNVISADVKTSLKDGRKKQVVVIGEDGKPTVEEHEFTKDDADTELDYLEALAKKGKLTKEKFQSSYFGQVTNSSDLQGAFKEIEKDQEGFISKLRDAFEDKNSQQEEAAAEGEKNQEKVIYGTKNEITHSLQTGVGLPAIEIPKDRSDDESLSAWKDGKRTPQEITEHLLDPNTDIYDKSITPNDEPIMREYIRQLGERGRDLNKVKVNLQEKVDSGDKESEPDLASVTQQINRHLDEYNDALHASQVGGNIWHKYGDERQKAIDEQGLLVNAIERINNAYGNEVPKEVQAQLKDLQAKYDELQAKNDALQGKLTKKQAQKNVPPKVKPQRDFKKERSDIIDQLKKEWNKSFIKTYLTIPGVPQFEAIAPHVAKLVRSYAEEGIQNIVELVDKVHDAIKDIVDGITKDNVRDIIAGKYSQKRTLSDLTKEVSQIRVQARLLKKIEDIKNGIEVTTKKRGSSSPEVTKLHDELKKAKKEALNKYAHLSASELRSRSAQLEKQISKGDFFRQPEVKRTWESDPEWIKNNREKANLMFKLRKMEVEAMNSKKSKFMRSLDWTNRWGRRVIFFGANAVYTKLTSAAVLGSFLHRGVEQGLGGINAKMFPNISKNAPIEGNFNIGAEVDWYKDSLNPKQLAIDVKDIFLTGETRLSKELSPHPEGNHILGLDLFAADAHQMIKSPIKRATFEAAFKYQMNWYERQGNIDSTHPLVVESARQAAWQRANYEVFQDNPKNQTAVKKFFNDLEKSGILDRNKPDSWSKVKGNAKYSAAALYHFFIPINTVPVNILKRIGLGVSLPKTYMEAIAKNKSVRDGILNMTSEESDAILLQLKKGQVMAAYWTLGFVVGGSMAGGLYTNFYPNKERDKDAVTPDSDYLEFRGINISKDVQHNSQYQALQMGATWNMVYNHYIDDKGESQMMSIFAASAATAGAAAQEHPVVSTASSILDAIKTPHGNTKWVQDLRRRIGVQKAQDVFKMMGYDIGDDSEDFSIKKK
jgi:hypothetical protein